MNVQTLPLKDIKPYWRNPRNNEDAVAVVKASIERYGYNNPILVDEKKVIVAGHTRYKALMELGHEEASVIVLEGLSPEKAKEYRIADNKTAEYATWDFEALIPELRELGAENMQPFFQDFNLDNLLKDTSTVDMPTQSDIDKHQEKLDGRFEAASNYAQGNYVEVLCPHCAEEFYVDKSTIMNQAGVESPETPETSSN